MKTMVILELTDVGGSEELMKIKNIISNTVLTDVRTLFIILVTVFSVIVPSEVYALNHILDTHQKLLEYEHREWIFGMGIIVMLFVIGISAKFFVIDRKKKYY